MENVVDNNFASVGRLGSDDQHGKSAFLLLAYAMLKMSQLLRSGLDAMNGDILSHVVWSPQNPCSKTIAFLL